MLDAATIDARLDEMRVQADPTLLWDENCGGSARALVVFVGPSPGGAKTSERRPLKKGSRPAYWNQSFYKPLDSVGFRTSFSPLVEAIFSAPYNYAMASKLIVKANLDWLCNPDAPDVQEQFMREGASSVLRMIDDCSPDLVLPMEKIAFGVLKDVMKNSGFVIAECPVDRFNIRISEARAHRNLRCFRATSPRGHSLVVIKLPQHPARMLRADYATRCGKAVRTAARQIAAGRPVDVTEPLVGLGLPHSGRSSFDLHRPSMAPDGRLLSGPQEHPLQTATGARPPPSSAVSCKRFSG